MASQRFDQGPLAQLRRGQGARIAQPRHRRRASSSCCSGRRAAASPRCSTASPACSTSSAGQIFIGGKNVTWEEPKDRGIGMVFQSYALYPQMTVERNLSFGLRVARHAEGRDRAARRARRRDPADRAAAQAQAGRAVGRPAPARRHRPGAGARRRRVPVRRAALQPRCQAARRTCASRSSGCISGSRTP